jgi:hypothetical protein
MDDEARAKAREMLQMLFEHHVEEVRAMLIEHFLPGIEQDVRDFYAKHRQWPVFQKEGAGRLTTDLELGQGEHREG